MPIEYKKNQALFYGRVSVDDADDLLEWLKNKPAAALDLRACTQLHTVTLQMVMATSNRIVAWPDNPNLRVWLEMMAPSGGGRHGRR